MSYISMKHLMTVMDGRAPPAARFSCDPSPTKTLLLRCSVATVKDMPMSVVS